MKTALVVEDEHAIAELLMDLLHEEGFRVLCVRDGAQALEVLKEETPSVILSDVMMPKMDGAELCRRVRANATYNSIPIILMTAAYREINPHQVPYDALLQKPLSLDHLLETIQEVSPSIC